MKTASYGRLTGFMLFASAPLLLSLTACSHIKVVAFDKQANTVSVQGGKWASEEDIQKEAENYCHGPVTVLNMQQITVGSITSANAQAYGNSAHGSAITTGINRRVYTYSCNTNSTPTKSSPP